MEKIAVYCRTHEEWDAVQRRMFGRVAWTCWDAYKEDSCISVNNTGYANVLYYKNEGHSFITAQEYLGGKDVKEFEVGDRVECIKPLSGSLRMGEVFTITGITNDADAWLELGELKRSQYYKPERFKLAGSATKPKTTKENNMKENNTDSNVLAVFGSKVQGDELVVIDRHFTDNMLKEILMEKHHKAIQEACGKAEAKRLEKESKE